MHVLTQKRVPDSGYSQKIAAAIDKQLVVSAASSAESPFWDRHSEGLRSMKNLIQSLTGEHPLVYAAWISQSYGRGDSDSFEPGEEQQNFLSTIGLTGDLDSQIPDGLELLEEFIVLGFADAFARQADAINKRPAEAVAAESAQVREAQDRVEELEEKNAELSAKLSSLQGTNSSLEAALANLKRLAAAIGDKPPAEPDSNSHSANNRVQSCGERPTKPLVEQDALKSLATRCPTTMLRYARCCGPLLGVETVRRT